MNYNPLVIALDVPNESQAMNIVDQLGDLIDVYKIGSQLYANSSKEFRRKLKRRGKKIFLDLKLNDIPNTLANTIKIFDAEHIDYLSVFCDLDSLNRILNAPKWTKLLYVTRLSSKPFSSVENIDISDVRSKINSTIFRYSSIISGFIVPAWYMCRDEEIKSHFSNKLFFTPGIRPGHEGNDDHFMAITPEKAISSGADYIIIGRPVLTSKNKKKTVNKILETINYQ